jgi:histone-lysine N-methyltransferase SETMAR
MTSVIAKICDSALVEMCFKMKLSRVQCTEKLNELYKKEAPSTATVYAYYEALQSGAFSYIDPTPIGKSRDEMLIKRVAEIVKDNPFLSLRKIAAEVDSNKDSVRDILVNVLQMKKRYMKWLPHILTDSIKKQRVSIARKMLSILRASESCGFHSILTGDESWVLYDFPYDSYWGKTSEHSRTVIRPSIGTSKILLVVFWGVDWTPILTFLRRGDTMTSERFVETVVTPLTGIAGRMSEDEPLHVHWDNAPSHSAKATQEAVKKSKMQIIPQPPYSPDIDPSDFFLLGYLKNQLRGKKCKSAEELIAAVQLIINGITKPTRVRVFQDWMWRLQSVISSGGEYC